MYIWRLSSVISAEMDVDTFVKKANKAKLSSVWIKVADGPNRYTNVNGPMAQTFRAASRKLKNKGIAVWGWHVPHAATQDDAKSEAELVGKIADEFSLDGILMDAESESTFFRGDKATGELYATQLRQLLEQQNKGLAISSHDIPRNFPGFPFDAFARHATVNAPQVYYGGSPSVENRLSRAITANSHLQIPFVPVGAGWIGDAGGCSSAAASAEKAIVFMRLVRDCGFPGYSFWHWEGCPAKLWQVLFSDPV
jgi:hypothetical protein